MADVYGLIPSRFGLIHIEMEFKSGGGRLDPDQKKWKTFITEMGGHYFEVRDFETIQKEIEAIIRSTPTFNG